MTNLTVGTRIADALVVERVLSRPGAANEAALVRDAHGGHSVVQVLAASASQPRVVSRFARAQHIDSPYVPYHLDVGTLADGRMYVRLEYLEGESLKVRLAAPQPTGALVRHVRQACEALAVAHAAGVAHRRLRTSSLFLARVGRGDSVRLLDLVSALPAEDATGEAVDESGPFEYLAPEQLTTRTRGDRRCDQWAIGVILYEACTRRLPFTGASRKLAAVRAIGEAPVPPRTLRPEIPVELERIILRCLEKAPERRFEDMGQLASALQPFAAGHAGVHEDSSEQHRASDRAELSVLAGTLPSAKAMAAEPASAEDLGVRRLTADGRVETLNAGELARALRAPRVADAGERVAPAVPGFGAQESRPSNPGPATRESRPSHPGPAARHSLKSSPPQASRAGRDRLPREESGKRGQRGGAAAKGPPRAKKDGWGPVAILIVGALGIGLVSGVIAVLALQRPSGGGAPATVTPGPREPAAAPLPSIDRTAP